MAVAIKDLRVDARAKQVAPLMAIFALSVVFVASFALPPGSGGVSPPPPVAGAISTREIAASLLWLAAMFAATLGSGRAAAQESEGGRFEALSIAPVDPLALFAGKCAANFFFLMLMQIFVVPVWILLVDIPVDLVLPEILFVALAVNIGIAATGTLFGTVSQFSTNKSLVMTLLALPVMLPAILAAIRLTAGLSIDGTLRGEGGWLMLLLVFDIVFVALGAVLYQFVIED